MLGLTLALDLAKLGQRVTLYEAGSEVGGLSSATTFGSLRWDRFYHCVLPSDRALLALFDELGLGGELRWRRVYTGVYLNAAIRPFDGALDLLRLPRLGLIPKLRIGLLAARGGGRSSDAELDDTTALAWLRRRCGSAAVERFWAHLLRCKLGEASEQVAARFLHTTIARLRSARGVAGAGERLGHVAGGYRVVLQRLRATLAERGVEVLTGQTVVGIAGDGDSAVVTTADRRAVHSGCVLTAPNPVIAGLVVGLDADTARALAATPYLGVACTVAVGASSLSRNYLLNLCDPGFRITGVVEMSNLARPERDAAPHSLVYLPRYAPSDAACLRRDEGELIDDALADLRRVAPATADGWCRHVELQRARLVQPLPFAGAPVLRAPERRLGAAPIFAVNSSQLPSCVLNNNDIVTLAHRAASGIAAAIAAQASERR